MANIFDINRTTNTIALGTTGTTINVTSHTASTILGLDASKDLESLAIPLIVANGGTGLATITDGGLLLGSGTGAITPLAQATNGQLPIGSTGVDCVLATLTGTANQIIVTNGAGSITLSTPQDIHMGASPTFVNTYLTGFLRLAQKAGTTTDGDLWNDSTQEALQTFVSGIEQTLVGTIFTQTADQTIADTTTETTLFGTGVGTLTLPANFWTVGKTIRIEIHGDLADAGNPTVDIHAYYGTTKIIDSSPIALSGLAGVEEWECEVVITCRSIGASGTVQTVIDWEYETSVGSSAIERLDVEGVLQTIDTTASGVLDVTFQWGAAAAANTIHSHVAFVTVLN